MKKMISCKVLVKLLMLCKFRFKNSMMALILQEETILNLLSSKLLSMIRIQMQVNQINSNNMTLTFNNSNNQLIHKMMMIV